MGKKVLLLCQFFYPDYVSSAVLPTQLAEELSKAGFNVSVICGWPQEFHDGEPVSGSEVYNGIKIKRVKYASFNSKKKLGRLLNFFSFFIAVLFQLPKIMRQRIVFVYTNPPILPIIGYWASRLSKTKFVFVGFDLYPDNAIAINAIKKNGFIVRLMKYINRKVYKNAVRVVAISNDMKEFMLNNHLELEENRAVVIPNWYTGEVERDDSDIGEVFRNLRNSWKMIVLYSGNMGEAQELDTIIDSILEIKNTKLAKDVLFVFSGNGSKQAEIENIFKDNKVNNVKFFGFLKGKDYADALNISDICLVSLKKGVEGLGVPSRIYGFFAFGKPVISIMSEETELAKNILTYNAGFNISQGDTDSFIEKIEKFYYSPAFLYETSKNSLEIHTKLYEKKLAIDKYVKLINELIS